MDKKTTAGKKAASKKTAPKKVAKKNVTKKKAATKKTTAKKSTARASKRPTKAAAMSPPAPRTAFTDEQIRQRAFEIYRSGRHPQNPDADWYDAVRELSSESGLKQP